MKGVITPQEGAAFSGQIAARRRGPKKRVGDRVPTSVKLPVPLFNALCRGAAAHQESLHAYMLRTLATAVTRELR